MSVAGYFPAAKGLVAVLRLLRCRRFSSPGVQCRPLVIEPRLFFFSGPYECRPIDLSWGSAALGYRLTWYAIDG